MLWKVGRWIVHLGASSWWIYMQLDDYNSGICTFDVVDFVDVVDVGAREHRSLSSSSFLRLTHILSLNTRTHTHTHIQRPTHLDTTTERTMRRTGCVDKHERSVCTPLGSSKTCAVLSMFCLRSSHDINRTFSWNCNKTREYFPICS